MRGTPERPEGELCVDCQRSPRLRDRNICRDCLHVRDNARRLDQRQQQNSMGVTHEQLQETKRACLLNDRPWLLMELNRAFEAGARGIITVEDGK